MLLPGKRVLACMWSLQKAPPPLGRTWCLRESGTRASNRRCVKRSLKFLSYQPQSAAHMVSYVQWCSIVVSPLLHYADKADCLHYGAKKVVCARVTSFSSARNAFAPRESSYTYGAEIGWIELDCIGLDSTITIGIGSKLLDCTGLEDVEFSWPHFDLLAWHILSWWS